MLGLCFGKNNKTKVLPLANVVKILFLGIKDAGKSCLINNLIGKRDPLKTLPTIGFAKPQPLKIGDTSCVLHELGGNKAFRNAWGKRLSKSDIIVFLVSYKNNDDFLESLDALKSLLKHADASDMAKFFLVRSYHGINPHFEKDFNEFNKEFNFNTVSITEVVHELRRQVFSLRDKDSEPDSKPRLRTNKVLPEILSTKTQLNIEQVMCQNNFRNENGCLKQCVNKATKKNKHTNWQPWCDNCINNKTNISS